MPGVLLASTDDAGWTVETVDPIRPDATPVPAVGDLVI